MKNQFLILLPLVAAINAMGAFAQDSTNDPQVAEYRAMLNQYCVACHTPEGIADRTGLFFREVDLGTMAEHPERTETIIRKLRAGLMPPYPFPRPDAELYENFIAWMENEIDSTTEPYLPAPGLHRLNRTEYTNSIRDLLSLNIDASKFLPADDSSHGFDNMAGTLTSSPALMEAYLSAAGKISRLAIGTETAPTLSVFDVPVDTSQNSHIDGLPFGTRGGMLIEHEFPADGEYVFTVKGMTGYFTRVLGNVKGEQLEVTIDGERVYLYDWDNEIGNTEGNGGRSPAIPIKAGFHRVGVTFIATTDLPDTGINKSFQRTMNSPGAISGYTFYPHVGQVFIEGPYNGSPATETRSRKKIFECYPQNADQEAGCARQIIDTLLTKAFRRNVSDDDVEVIMNFYQAGKDERGTFDHGIEAALQRILVDPEFIYRSEIEPAQVAEGEPYKISELELASRLSFFLWSSIPDEELIKLATENRLSDPQVMRQQVQRMFADPRSQAFVENFTGQWLNVRGMAASEPVVEMFPDFDSTLRDAFRQEIELFFAGVIQQDLSVLDMLDADFTYVNERLAKHYGIPDVYGEQFRMVELGDDLDMRRGLLGKGALLTITSEAARTSPVKRGKWFLETFFGVSPPDPPPGVETDLTPKPGEAPKTLRQRMEAHRTNPICSSCHTIFEPLGLALENFDPVGAWRLTDSGNVIDPTGYAPDGTYLEGVQSLRGMLKNYQGQFATVVTEKLLTYALGRGVEFEDMPMLREIMAQASEDDYSFSSLVMGVVQSTAFTMNMKNDLAMNEE